MAKDPFRYFRIEANELVDQLGKGVLNLEKGSAGNDVILCLLRLAHTLKGAARVVKQAEIADLSHGLEDILLPFRDGKQVPSHDAVDQALRKIDAISAQLTQLPPPEAPEATNPVVTTVPSAPLPAARIVRSDFVEVDSLLEGLGEIGSELGSVRRALESIERVQKIATQIATQQNLSPGKLKSVAEEMQTLLNTTERTMSEGILRIDRELREARDAAERLRLIPIAGIFNTLERTARDAAHITGKIVEFQAKGGEVRIDGAMLDIVQNALIQVVRNAVAHGIELPEQRRINAKSTSGRITLTVERRGYRAWFRCHDDGAGIDVAAVKNALIQKGMPSANVDNLSAESLMTQLLKGGVSTTSVPTEISGRGIGLDLVSEAMHQLGGEIAVHSEPGQGTSIELSIPLSLAALDVLVVENGGDVAALPLDAVRCTLRIKPEDIISTPNGKVIIYDNKQIPYLPLQIHTTQKSSNPTRALTVVILATTDVNTTAALAVDRLSGMDTVILRALPVSCPVDPIVLGVHLDGEGNPRMVLDPEVLIKRRWFGQDHADKQVVTSKADLLPILIIDDSLTTRMLESSILESAGFKVELATCAEDGLDMARRKRYGLFLVDVEMPGMCGFDFVSYVKKDAALKHTPCILVSSCNTAEDRRRGVECGASAYIVKGEFDQVKFLDRVSQLTNSPNTTNVDTLAELEMQ